MTSERVDPENPLPLYFQVYKSLLDRIVRGEFAPGSFLPPERQLTEDYGVSRITIIKALDGLAKERYVKRQQGRGTIVLDPAERAISLVPEARRRSIAFICHTLDHPYLFQILQGIARTASRQHFNLQVISSYGMDDVEGLHIKEALARSVDGIIVYPHHGYQNAALYRELQQQHFPIVMVDRYYPQIETDRVIFDDEVASFDLTTQLLDRGHRRIAVIPYFEVEATSVNHRLSGYRRALQQQGLQYEDDLIWLDIYPAFEPSDELPQDTLASERLRKYLVRYKPDALLPLNADVMERIIYDLLTLSNSALFPPTGAAPRRTTLSWKGEIATFSHKAPIPSIPFHVLTAVHSGDMLGAEAARLLIGRIEHALEDDVQTIRVPMNIVASESRGALTQSESTVPLE
jgi:GntR family transcriptional regulator of arabinose operon